MATALVASAVMGASVLLPAAWSSAAPPASPSSAAVALTSARPRTAAVPVRRPRPPAPRTLGALNALMGRAVQAKGSVHLSHAFVVTDGRVSARDEGDARWDKGTLSFDVTDSGQYVAFRTILLPDGIYERSLKEWSDTRWYRFRPQDQDPFRRDYLAELRQTLDPSRLYPGLSRLAVTRGTPRTVDGVTCWPFTVRMTLRQLLATVPPEMRWDAAPAASAKTVTTFLVDVHGLPHKVVEFTRDGHTTITRTSTFTRWGAPVTVTAPSGPVTDAATAG